MKSKKILIICPFPRDVAAGQRLKYEQYLNHWETLGYEITIEPFMNHNLWNIVYKKGYLLKKIFYSILGYFKRIKLIYTIKEYDLVYVFLWVTPMGTTFFEKMVRKKSRRLIYDIEDNILEKQDNPINRIFSFLKSNKKTIYLIQNADHVIASSSFLAKFYCKKINVFSQSTFISSSVNINYHTQKNFNKSHKKITLGWTGTFSSRIYLESIEHILKKLTKKHDFKLLIISNFDYYLEGVDVEVIKWNKQSEINDLHKIDIGIYPLLDNNWVLGKSGLKAIQYMSIGIPTVATNVGTSSDIITHMENGILVDTENDWLKHLSLLIMNPELRKKIGSKARQTVIKYYSTEVLKYKYLEVLNKVSRLKVGIIFSSGELGGAEKSLTKMSLVKNSIDYTIITFGEKGPFFEWLESIKLQVISLGNSVNLFSIIQSIKIIKTFNLDIVYVSGLKISLLLRLIIFFFTKTKFIHAMRHSPYSDSYYDKLFRSIEIIGKYFVDFYISNSLSAKKTLIKKSGLKDKNISVIYNGLDFFPKLEDIKPIHKRNNIIITVANINYRKGHLQFLSVIKKIIKIIPDVKFIFIGRDDLKGIVQKKINEFKISNNIEIVGFKTDVTLYYKMAKLFVLPSIWGEGCPTSIMESLSWGVPVISYEVGGCSEIVDNNVDGMIIPQNNSELLYKSIIDLLRNDEKLIQMSKEGFKNSKKYILQKCSLQHEEIFNYINKRNK